MLIGDFRSRSEIRNCLDRHDFCNDTVRHYECGKERNSKKDGDSSAPAVHGIYPYGHGHFAILPLV